MWFLFCREAISRLCEAVPGANGAIKKRKVNIDVVFLFDVSLTSLTTTVVHPTTGLWPLLEGTLFSGHCPDWLCLKWQPGGSASASAGKQVPIDHIFYVISYHSS